LFDAVNDAECGSRTGLINAHQHTALAVGQDNVGLRRKAIADMRDILQINGCAVDGFYRQVVELRYGLWTSVHFDVVFERAKLDGASGENEVLRADGVHDIDRREALGL
jgi:hypothetical protein